MSSYVVLAQLSPESDSSSLHRAIGFVSSRFKQCGECAWILNSTLKMSSLVKYLSNFLSSEEQITLVETESFVSVSINPRGTNHFARQVNCTNEIAKTLLENMD